ncbi:phosphotransferase family protein [Peribacillus alkalitolerans]|uniref:phosphotransferase family protein n=1 Tax=Peribacillus alkalitolerans TaxID=1550385 RepID=UPI0013D69D6C|nr:aminoglycoside phosphotransferase family protein [Peribacillus alkalitolerans]
MSNNNNPSLPSMEEIAYVYDDCFRQENRQVLSVILTSSTAKLRKWILEYQVTYLNEEGKKEEEFLIGKIYSDQEKGIASYQVLKYLWANGMANEPAYTIIRPIAYIESYSFLLMSKAPGKALNDYLGESTENIQIASRVASWLKHLHDIPATMLREMKQTRGKVDLTRFYKDLALLLPEKENRLKALYISLQEESAKPWNVQPVMLHGDFHLKNLFVDEKHVTAIDFDHHFFGDPAWDVAYLSCQVQIRGILKEGNFYQYQPFVISFLETYLNDFPEHMKGEYYKRFYLYRARSLFESLHYELCVLNTGKLDIVDAFLGECELSLQGRGFS